jgi:hypothetical protein
MAITDIMYDGDAIFQMDSIVGGNIISIDFPFAVWVFIPYHGYITKSRLIGGV